MGSFLWGLPQNEVSTRAGQLHGTMGAGSGPFEVESDDQRGVDIYDLDVLVSGADERLNVPSRQHLLTWGDDRGTLNWRGGGQKSRAVDA